MPLYLWPVAGGGKALLIRTMNGVTGLAKDVDCCCKKPSGGCCGRLQPGPDSLEGAAYYPLTLHCRISIAPGSACTKPNPAVEFDVTWDAGELHWSNNAIDMGDDTATLLFSCIDETGWDAAFTWGICSFTGNPMTFSLVPTLTDGECDPVDLEATIAMTGLMCCGNLAGGSILIEVWE